MRLTLCLLAGGIVGNNAGSRGLLLLEQVDGFEKFTIKLLSHYYSIYY